MRPASIIFLVISLLISFGGYYLCGMAEERAAADGVELFNISTDAEGNRVSVMDYDPAKMEKISISLKAGNVNIMQGDECKIEIYNLFEGGYVKGVSGNVLQINDTMGIMDIIREGAQGISFSGLRNILHDIQPLTKDKWINVYIPAGTALNCIEITVLEGGISCTGIQDTDADMLFTAENGGITVENSSTNSRMQLKSSGDVTVRGSFSNDLRIEAAEGNVTVTKGTTFISADINVTKKGNINLDLTQSIAQYIAEISGTESIMLNGASLNMNTFLTEVSSGMKLIAKTADGAVVITD